MIKWDDFIETHEADLAAEPDNLDLVVETMRFYFYINHWYRAKELALKIIDLNPDSDQGYFFLGYCEYQLGNERDAYDILDQALEKDPTNMDSYLLQLKLLIRNGVYETAHDLVNYLHRCGADQDPVLQWCENWLFYCEKQAVGDNDMRGILARYYELDEVFQGIMTQDRSDFYYQFALCVHQYEPGITEEQVLNIVNRGLEANPHHRSCLDFLAWLLKRMGENEKAIVVYETLRSFPSHDLGTEVCLLELYDPNMLPYMSDVLDCIHGIEKQYGENEEFHYYKGRYYYFLGKYDQAIFHLKKVQEIAPEKMGGYRSLGFAYMAQKKYEEALELADGALLLSQGWGKRTRYYLHKAQLYRRMKDPYAAVGVIQEMMLSCQEEHANGYLFEIYAQFGLWSEVEELLAQWERNYGEEEDRISWALASMKYAIYKGDYFTAQALWDQYHEKISKEELAEIEQVLYAWKGDYQQILELWLQRMEEADEPDENVISYYEHRIALAYFMLNQLENARIHANRGLMAMVSGKESFPNEKALYQTRRSGLLFLAGSEEAALKEINRVKQMSLCEHCIYSECKDLKVFEVEAAYLKGDYRTGLKLIQEYRLLWPDDMELVLFENLMSITGSYLS